MDVAGVQSADRAAAEPLTVMVRGVGVSLIALLGCALALGSTPERARAGADADLCFAGSGNAGLDIEACTRALGAGGDPLTRSTLHVRRAAALLQIGQHRFAGDDLEAALALNRYSAEAYRLLGAVRSKAGDTGGALRAYDRSIELFPSHAKAYRDRGVTQLFAGAVRKAVADLSASVQRNPFDPEAWAFRGFANFALARYAQADADFERCTALAYPYDYLPLWRALVRQNAGAPWRDALQRAAVAYAPDEWPAALLFAAAGDADAGPALAAVDGRRGEARAARAHFYLGALARAGPDPQRAQGLLAQAQRDAPPDSVEHWMAEVLLAR